MHHRHGKSHKLRTVLGISGTAVLLAVGALIVALASRPSGAASAAKNQNEVTVATGGTTQTKSFARSHMSPSPTHRKSVPKSSKPVPAALPGAAGRAWQRCRGVAGPNDRH